MERIYTLEEIKTLNLNEGEVVQVDVDDKGSITEFVCKKDENGKLGLVGNYKVGDKAPYWISLENGPKTLHFATVTSVDENGVASLKG